MKVGEDPKVWFNVSTNLHRASNTYHSLTLSSKGPPEIRDVRPILSKASSDLMTAHWLLQGTLSLSLSLSRLSLMQHLLRFTFHASRRIISSWRTADTCNKYPDWQDLVVFPICWGTGGGKWSLHWLTISSNDKWSIPCWIACYNKINKHLILFLSVSLSHLIWSPPNI